MNDEQDQRLSAVYVALYGDNSRYESGLIKKTATLYEMLHGTDSGSFGLAQKVNIMWRTHILWPLMGVSMIFGGAITLVLQRVFHQ